jgi:hypothetical protein
MEEQAIELPPMPEPTWEMHPTNPPRRAFAWFTRDQMQAFARAAVLLERERCAKLCEELRDKALSAQHGRQDDLQNVMLRQVAHVGAGECAAAIRKGTP